MKVMHRKLIRDLRTNLGTLLSVIAITVIGAGVLIGLGSTQRNLEASQRAYYRAYRFADFWIDLKKAPMSAVKRLADLPGIDTAQGRVVYDVILDLEGEARPVTGRLISTPVRQSGQTLNDICLVRGAWFTKERDEEVILSEAFARAHHLLIGDRVAMILNGKRQTFVIVGTAISPEYVYMVRGAGDLTPDPRHFGVLYVKDAYAREVLGFQDACNQIVGRLARDETGRTADIQTLLGRMDRMLEPFGVISRILRRRQASNRYLSDEIAGLGVSAKIMPAIFLGVAALVLNILMIRMVQRQRTTIGTLKALGYADRLVVLHYLGFAALVGMLGGALGAALGIALSCGLNRFYTYFFQFPDFVFDVYPDLILIGVAVCILFSVAGALRGVWSVLGLGPAEAMRQKPPERGGRILIERIAWLWRRIGFRWHMALRGVFRNRVRSATAVIAAAMSVAIVFLALAAYDAFLYLVEYQFEQVAHSDVDIGMRDESSIEVLYEARALPGVDVAEPILAVNCDLNFGPNTRRMVITGLSKQDTLTTPRLASGERIHIPDTGLVLSRKLAELLDVHQGQKLRVTPVRGRRETHTVPVVSIADTFVGLSCYADIRYLSGLVGESLAVNGLQLAVDPAETDALYRQIKKLPNAQNLSQRADTKASIEKTVVDSSLVLIGLMVIFAGVIALGSTVTNTLIEIGDRAREIATLRVIGYHPGQIAGILLRQNLVTYVVGVLLAMPLGYTMTLAMVRAYDTELYRIPLVIRPRVILGTLALALLFMVISQFIVMRQVRKLDWLEGINVKE